MIDGATVINYASLPSRSSLQPGATADFGAGETAKYSRVEEMCIGRVAGVQVLPLRQPRHVWSHLVLEHTSAISRITAYFTDATDEYRRRALRRPP